MSEMVSGNKTARNSIRKQNCLKSVIVRNFKCQYNTFGRRHRISVCFNDVAGKKFLSNLSPVLQSQGCFVGMCCFVRELWLYYTTRTSIALDLQESGKRPSHIWWKTRMRFSFWLSYPREDRRRARRANGKEGESWKKRFLAYADAQTLKDFPS